MDEIPDSVLLRVFSFANLTLKLHIRLISKRWNDLWRNPIHFSVFGNLSTSRLYPRGVYYSFSTYHLVDEGMKIAKDTVTRIEFVAPPREQLLNVLKVYEMPNLRQLFAVSSRFRSHRFELICQEDAYWLKFVNDHLPQVVEIKGTVNVNTPREMLEHKNRLTDMRLIFTRDNRKQNDPFYYRRYGNDLIRECPKKEELKKIQKEINGLEKMEFERLSTLRLTLFDSSTPLNRTMIDALRIIEAPNVKELELVFCCNFRSLWFDVVEFFTGIQRFHKPLMSELFELEMVAPSRFNAVLENVKALHVFDFFQRRGHFNQFAIDEFSEDGEADKNKDGKLVNHPKDEKGKQEAIKTIVDGMLKGVATRISFEEALKKRGLLLEEECRNSQDDKRSEEERDEEFEVDEATDRYRGMDQIEDVFEDSVRRHFDIRKEFFLVFLNRQCLPMVHNLSTNIVMNTSQYVSFLRCVPEINFDYETSFRLFDVAKDDAEVFDITAFPPAGNPRRERPQRRVGSTEKSKGFLFEIVKPLLRRGQRGQKSEEFRNTKKLVTRVFGTRYLQYFPNLAEIEIEMFIIDETYPLSSVLSDLKSLKVATIGFSKIEHDGEYTRRRRRIALDNPARNDDNKKEKDRVRKEFVVENVNNLEKLTLLRLPNNSIFTIRSCSSLSKLLVDNEKFEDRRGRRFNRYRSFEDGEDPLPLCDLKVEYCESLLEVDFSNIRSETIFVDLSCQNEKVSNTFYLRSVEATKIELKCPQLLKLNVSDAHGELVVRKSKIRQLDVLSNTMVFRPNFLEKEKHPLTVSIEECSSLTHFYIMEMVDFPIESKITIKFENAERLVGIYGKPNISFLKSFVKFNPRSICEQIRFLEIDAIPFQEDVWTILSTYFTKLERVNRFMIENGELRWITNEKLELLKKSWK